jgi:spermidine/putrescine transport system ATP-binding protein
MSQASERRDLRLAELEKTYGGFTAVHPLDLVVPQGSFFALLGPSGCGKTTTLRMIAGLETPTAGRISIGDVDITYDKPYKRPVNTVFQNYALFPHLSIAGNIAFGLRQRGIKRPQQQVADMLDLVELGGQGGKRPQQLSGGQQQRVALARALINQPEVLLLDEPLGALDLKLRRSMQLELKRIQTEVGLTFVHVTHDQEEAMTLADTIAVMNAGTVEQMGTPAELYENPHTTFVANFLGQSNLIRGRILGEDTLGGEPVVKVDMQGTVVSIRRQRAHVPHAAAGAGWVGIRPEKVVVVPAGESLDVPGSSFAGGTVIDTSFIGVSTQYVIKTAWGEEIAAFEQNTGARPVLAPGTAVDFSWRPEFAFLLDASQDASAGISVDGEGE